MLVEGRKVGEKVVKVGREVEKRRGLRKKFLKG